MTRHRSSPSRKKRSFPDGVANGWNRWLGRHRQQASSRLDRPGAGVTHSSGMLGWRPYCREEICVMSKTALAIGLAGLLLATVSTNASAMPVMPMSKSLISGLNSGIDQVGWQRC
jgi:hypothetical protein